MPTEISFLNRVYVEEILVMLKVVIVGCNPKQNSEHVHVQWNSCHSMLQPLGLFVCLF